MAGVRASHVERCPSARALDSHLAVRRASERERATRTYSSCKESAESTGAELPTRGPPHALPMLNLGHRYTQAAGLHRCPRTRKREREPLLRFRPALSFITATERTLPRLALPCMRSTYLSIYSSFLLLASVETPFFFRFSQFIWKRIVEEKWKKLIIWIFFCLVVKIGYGRIRLISLHLISIVP